MLPNRDPEPSCLLARDDDIIPTPYHNCPEMIFSVADPDVSVCTWIVSLIFGLKIILLFLYLIMCLSHCMFPCVYTKCLCVCSSQKEVTGCPGAPVFSVRLGTSKTQQSSCLYPHWSCDYRLARAPGWLCGCWDPNSRPHGSTASAFHC